MRTEQPANLFCTTSETKGEVIHYWPFQGGSSVVFSVACFLVSEFRLHLTLRVFILFLVRVGLLKATFKEIAAHPVDHIFSMEFDSL